MDATEETPIGGGHHPALWPLFTVRFGRLSDTPARLHGVLRYVIMISSPECLVWTLVLYAKLREFVFHSYLSNLDF